MTLSKLIRDPLAWLVTAVGAVIGLVNGSLIGPLWGALWASSGDLFTLVSLGALTLPPHIPPQSSADWLVLVVGGLFVTKVGQRVWQDFDRRF